MTTLRDVGPLRLAAQHVAGPGLAEPRQVVEWLTCVQAQDLPGALTSIALRTRSGAARSVTAALDAGEILRSWPMRGTLHLVPAVDLGWQLGLTAERLIRAAATRRARLGLDDPTVKRAGDVAVEALGGGRALSRGELLAVWEREGIPTQQGCGYHLLVNLAQTGILCLGPTRGREQLVVLLDEWVNSPRQLERDEALGEWALRYFRSHGPATVADFTRWTGLTAKDVRTGIAIARPNLASVELDGAEYLMDVETPAMLEACRGEADGVFLLPGFDEFVLGYGDRSAVLPVEFAPLIVPGNNGVFKPTVVERGQVVGTWRREGRGARQRVVAEPFTAFAPTVTEALPRLAEALP